MTQRKLQIACLVLLQAMFFANTSQAGPVLDWLFGRTTAYYPTVPTATCNDPCNTCQPVVCQQPVVRYMPTTCYRTTWARVPVTTYRPVASADPCTGCRTTVMRPCTTYRWEARRVPYTTYRPVYYSVRRPALSFPVAGTTAYSPVLSSSCSSCNQVPFSPSAISTSVPTTTTIVPASPTLAPTPAVVPATPLTPADETPVINPSDFEQNLQGSNTRQFQLGANQTEQPEVEGPILNRPFTTPRTDNAVTPVRDPDGANVELGPLEAAPQLLDPRDKTASREPSRIVPATLTKSIETAKPAETKTKKWTSSGWKSVKK